MRPLKSDANAAQLIRSLPPGPLAIIGDIHGEIEALDALLAHLDQDHPTHRLVFLGDLADRGPDSPAVIERVMDHVERGALCILGNHELSVLRGLDKGYNRWFFSNSEPWTPRETGGAPVPMATLPSERRGDVLAFFAGLPLALVRDDVRIVHACWDAPSVAGLRQSEGSVVDRFNAAVGGHNPNPRPTALSDRTARLTTRDAVWEAFEEDRQNANPVAVLTSGRERRADEAAGDRIVWSGNQWRPLVRDRWWDRYDDPTPVVIGHYSRVWNPAIADPKSDLMFPERDARLPVGRHKNVYCVDFGVGTRFHRRHDGRQDADSGRLAALLWDDDERRLVFDDGERAAMSGWLDSGA